MPPELERIASGIETVVREIARWRTTLDAVGVPLAATYMEGACDALAHAFGAIAKASASIPGGEAGVLLHGGGALRLRLLADGWRAEVVGGVPPARPGRPRPTIGAALAADMAIVSRLRADRLACGMVSAALGQHDWIHLASDAVWTGDPVAGAAVVSTLCGTDDFPTWTRWQMRGLVEREAADALAGLGWHRLSGPALPTSRPPGSC